MMDLNQEPDDMININWEENVVDGDEEEHIINEIGLEYDGEIKINDANTEKQDSIQTEGSFGNATICKPQVGMEFDDVESSRIFYTKYARATGFSVRIRSTQKNKAGLVSNRNYVCSKEGEKAKDSRQVCSKHLPDTRCGCLAHLNLKLIKETNKYKVTSFEEKHNHDLEGPLTAIYLKSHRNIDEIKAMAIDIAVEAGLGPKTTYKYMSLEAGGSVNLGFIKDDIKSFLRKPRQKNLKLGEANSILEYFGKKKKVCHSFFYSYQLDSEGKIANIFWADMKMIVDYQVFGDVVMFDTTFGTNKASRPLGIFTGFNNHRQCAVFGGCLMFDETIPSFSWVFQIFLDCHGGKKPIIIFTDQDAAMMNALGVVMPEVRHCLCSWHIIHNITTKMKGTLGGDFDNFLTDFKKCMYANCDVSNFEQMWNGLQEKYNYLAENKRMKKLHSRREKWSVAYRTDLFSAGVRSTQLVECTNGRLKRELGSGITMKRFFRGFDVFLDGVRETEKRSDCKSRQTFPHLPIRNAGILKHAAQVYTPRMFARFSEQFDKMHDIFLDEMNFIQGPHVRNAIDGNMLFRINYDPCSQTISCTCHMFEMCGYLCAHILRVFDVCRIREIPSKYVINRWSKSARSGLAIVDSPCPELSDMESIAMASSNFHRLVQRTGGKTVYIDRIMKFIAEEHEFINKNEKSEGNENSMMDVQSNASTELIGVGVTGLKNKENAKGSRQIKRHRSCLEKGQGTKSTKTKSDKLHCQPLSQINGKHGQSYNLRLASVMLHKMDGY